MRGSDFTNKGIFALALVIVCFLPGVFVASGYYVQAKRIRIVTGQEPKGFVILKVAMAIVFVELTGAFLYFVWFLFNIFFNV